MTYLYSKADIVHLARLVVAKVARKAIKIIRRSFDHLEGPASEVFRVELDSAITRMNLPEGGYLFAAPHLPHLKPDDSFFVQFPVDAVCFQRRLGDVDLGIAFSVGS